jgi:putative DNA methylase
VRYYGQWMRDEAEKRIGHLYPKIEITADMAKERPDLKKYVGKKLTVIAWLWARTVHSPNPAYAQVEVPLAATFMLSTKPGKEAYVEPVIDSGHDLHNLQDTNRNPNPANPAEGPVQNPGYRFTVKVGKPRNPEAAKDGTKLGHGANFRCLMSGAPISGDYIKAEGKAGRMGARLMAIVAEGDRGRVYLPPTPEMEAIARQAQPTWQPDVEISGSTQYLGAKPYGMHCFSDLFTPRQMVALTAFSHLVQEARERAQRDAVAAGPPHRSAGAGQAGLRSEFGATAYADAVALYLAFAVDRMAMTGNNLVRWNSVGEKAQHCFGRQALPMLWDFAEPNFLATATGSIDAAVFYSSDPLQWMDPPAAGTAKHEDAATQQTSNGKVVSTDPPYYDNVPYADLSDFFYVWLRRALRRVFPDLFATLAVPKADELVAFAYRHRDKAAAGAFFLDGMRRAMQRLATQAHPAFPVTIYYAFKQQETRSEGREDRSERLSETLGNQEGSRSSLLSTLFSTGWETFLDAVIQAGLALTGTWPIRTEMRTRQRAMDTNALASSIVLVCRPRAIDAPTATRREFLAALRAELPAALALLQRGNIAPVDLAQAAIGPGMGVYTRYARVLDAEGKALSVREALALINQTLDEVLAEQEGDFDADTRWALAWFEQFGFNDGPFGDADELSRAKNTSVGGMVEAGIVASRAGKARLLRPAELAADWDPATDKRLTAWEMVHQLTRALDQCGEGAAAALVAALGGRAETARELAYRLYVVCERKKRAQDALAYNALVQSWPEIARLAQTMKPVQERLI